MYRALSMLLCGFAVFAPVASAQDDEVFVDPDSPSGKEYALPIEQARRQGAPEGQRARSTARSAPAPLFGEGVGDDSAAAPLKGSGDRKSTGGGTTARDPDPVVEHGARKGAAGSIAQAATPGGAADTALIVGAAAGIVLLGALLGLLLRRRATR